ncbi:5034_t:CDS:2 [Diversispora eburnea]|uniref:5034_t:CDS:1 n=1 Tax=Diversispora eburnea TaxID=1213867 RepID=A0A9N8W804_9GLOM|nr:5034_t:CDS:2 [Diversispora eburnea]
MSTKISQNRCFKTKELAEGAMRREAKRLYRDSGIIQEADDKYFDEYDGEIHFGENPEEIGYRREFGYAQITPVELENTESGDDVPSSTSEEDSSDDDDYYNCY